MHVCARAKQHHCLRPPHLHSTGLLPFAGVKTVISPVSSFGLQPIKISLQVHWLLCGLSMPSIPNTSTRPSVDCFPDCLPFTGFLSAPRSCRLLSCYRQLGADRVKAVILESWARRRKMCTMFVRERDSGFPVHIIALLRIRVLSRCQT